MIDKSGKVKLMDFGIAKNTDVDAAEYTQTGTGMQMGTPMYMSPEQITETKSVTSQSDIYSLGVVLWQMVTGQKPYDTKTLSNFQLQTKIVSENLAETNTFWDRAIQKATSKDGQDRYKSCQELKKDLSSPAVEKEDIAELTQIDDLKKQVVIDDIKTQVVVDDIKTQVVNDDLKTQVVLQEEKIVKREERSEVVDAIPLNKLYFQLIAPVLILLSEFYLRFFWTENWYSSFYGNYSMNIFLVVIIVSIILLQRFKSSLSKSAFIYWMGFYVLNSIFVMGPHLYTVYTYGIFTYGNFVPYEYYAIWNFI
jgi:serine/threonine protein kinase